MEQPNKKRGSCGFPLNYCLWCCCGEAAKAPSDEGKRSAVAVVNASPVDWQSRDRARRSELSKISDF